MYDHYLQDNSMCDYSSEGFVMKLCNIVIPFLIAYSRQCFVLFGHTYHFTLKIHHNEYNELSVYVSPPCISY